MESGRGEAWEVIGHSNRLMSQQRRRGEVALMAPVNSQIGENGRKWKGRGERWNRGGDGVFLSLAELIVERPRGRDKSSVGRAYL
jgi:hypothetical protein